MECPNCGRQNSETSSYCSACAAPLKESRNSGEAKLEVARITGRVLLWFAAIILNIILVFLLLFLSSIAVVVLFDLLAGHRLLVGLGYFLALEGATIGFVGAVGSQNVPDKIVMTRKGGVPPVVFYKTVFKPVWSAMRSAPRTYYDNSLVIAIAGFLEAFVGLLFLS